jgi:hypothetical protein
MTVETGNGCALPVPVVAGHLEVDVVSDTLGFLRDCANKLLSAAAAIDDLEGSEPDVDEAIDQDHL